MSDRPSQSKVMGVSDKFLTYMEREMSAAVDYECFNNNDLDLDTLDVSYIRYTLGFRVMRNLVGLPFQMARAGYLEHAREVEGRRPGEETIAAFALSHCSDPERYPMSQSWIKRPHRS